MGWLGNDKVYCFDEITLKWFLQTWTEINLFHLGIEECFKNSLKVFERCWKEITGLEGFTRLIYMKRWSHCWTLQRLFVSLLIQELSGQLESQGKVDSASFQALVTALAQQNLAAAEELDLEQYVSRMDAWESEKRQLIQREKEMREKAEQEKQERLAAKAAAQQA